MAGQPFLGTFSATQGADLTPMFRRQDVDFRERKFKEDMRRALMGEDIAASELALRQDALNQQGQEGEAERNLRRELLGQQQGFQGEQAGLERGLRRELQGSQQDFQRGQQGRGIEATREQYRFLANKDESQFLRKLSFDQDRFQKEFALAQRSDDRAEKAAVIQNRMGEIQAALNELEFHERNDPNKRRMSRVKQHLELESLKLQNEARKQEIVLRPREHERESAIARQELEAGERALNQQPMTDRQALAARMAMDPNSGLSQEQRKEVLRTVLGDELGGILAGGDDAPAAGTAGSSLTKSEDDLRSRLQFTQQREGSDRGRDAAIQIIDELEALRGSEEEGAKRRIPRLEEYLKVFREAETAMEEFEANDYEREGPIFDKVQRLILKLEKLASSLGY